MSNTNSALDPVPVRSQRLINTEVFDAEYYAAECAREFPSKQIAARHFVQYGMKAGLSFHPLFDLGMFPSHVREHYKAGDVAYVLAYLRSPASREHRWSWLFDPAALTEAGVDGSLLLSKYRSGKPRALPVPDKLPGAAPAWPSVRDVMIAHARTVKAAELGKKPYRRTTWSQTEEDQWLEKVRNVAVSASGTSPVVSIVMPAWNRETVISDAIQSVWAQTFTSWELIVVDDGSTDGTREIVQAFARLNSRIRLVEAEHLGVCAARNRGIEEAQGEYLAFLDSDNTWRPDFLKNMCAGMEDSGAVAAYSAIRLLNDREEFAGQPITGAQLLVRNYIDLNVLVLRTSLARELGGFDNSLRRWVDYDLVLRITEHNTIEYFPFIGCDYIDYQNDDRITRSESANWEYAVLDKNVRARFGPDLPSDPAYSPTTSAIMRVTDRVDLAVRNIRKFRESIDPDGVELILLDETQGFRSSMRLRAALSGLENLKYIRFPRRYTHAISYNVAASHARGANLLFLEESTEVRPETALRLETVLADPSVAAVQPLVTDANGIVVSAGAAGQPHGLAIPLFRGLNIADARRHSGKGVNELSPAVFMVRATAFDKLGGFNPIFAGQTAVADLHRRLCASGTQELRVDPLSLAVDHGSDAYADMPPIAESDAGLLEARVTSSRTVEAHYADAGLTVAAFISPTDSRLRPAAPVVLRRGGGSAGQGLRWAIKIGADFTVGGDRWGDVPYAADLAAALVARGQEAVVDRFGAFARPSNHLDDIVLVIRGLHACAPQPGKLNVLWAISRPDLISRDELLGFDLVFGASRIWCDYVRSEWGVDARYLPQATNPRRFYSAQTGSAQPLYDLTFVGGPRKPVGRQIVADCVELGKHVNVWGARWAQFIDSDMVMADYVDNDELSAVYRSSRIVLNDHFEDMARWGFANNRLYDAVASGARVISDEVDGIDEIFKGAVRTYSTLDQLAELLTDPSAFPDDHEMESISRSIRDEHNFDVRADTLLAAVERRFQGEPGKL